jgi:hypothetical protein
MNRNTRENNGAKRIIQGNSNNNKNDDKNNQENFDGGKRSD